MPARPTQRVGESPRAAAIKVEHAHPMFSLDNTYNEDELREFDRRVRDGLDGERVAYVVEPKIDGASLEVIYERRQARARHHARRRPRRRRRHHRTYARCARLPLTLRDAARAHAARRGRAVPQRPRRDQRAPHRRRRRAVRQPAQRRRRLAAPARPAARPPNARCACSSTSWSSTTTRRTTKRSTRSPPPACPRTRHRLCPTSTSVLALHRRVRRERRQLPYDTDGVVVKVDRFDATRAPRHHLALSALGDRVQIRGRARVHRGARDRDRPRPHRRAHAGRRPRPGAALRHAGVARFAAQHRLRARKRRARRRHRQHRESRRDHPAGDQRVPRAAPTRDTAAGTPPERCPVCNTPVKRVEEEAALRCPNARCPGRIKAGIFYFTRRSAMDVDRLGRALD